MPIGPVLPVFPFGPVKPGMPFSPLLPTYKTRINAMEALEHPYYRIRSLIDIKMLEMNITNCTWERPESNNDVSFNKHNNYL